MRVLLSTIGSRGDVQPLVALALELRAIGQDVRFCVPPDFREWIDALGFSVTPIGPELNKLSVSRPAPATPVILSPERKRQMVDDSVSTQFETIAAAARDCDAIVGATALQIAAPSVAERMGIPYVFVAYCPQVLQSSHHAPILLRSLGDTPAPPTVDVRDLWAREGERFNDTFGTQLNMHRASMGLAAVTDVRSHIFTDRPWLAADPTLAPWPEPLDEVVFQPGAWIVPDDRPLAPEVETFLDAGEPPIYFGFGSMRAPEDLGRVMIQSARALGRRAIVSRGWAEVSLVDDARDCLAIGDVNHSVLFARVAAAVHHGGAGTTTAATAAGVPQIVIPQMYDQPYWAQRVEQLGIGTAHPLAAPTTDSLTRALERSLRSDVAERARAVAGAVRRDGAAVAAQRLMAIATRS